MLTQDSNHMKGSHLDTLFHLLFLSSAFVFLKQEISEEVGMGATAKWEEKKKKEEGEGEDRRRRRRKKRKRKKIQEIA